MKNTQTVSDFIDLLKKLSVIQINAPEGTESNIFLTETKNYSPLLTFPNSVEII